MITKLYLFDGKYKMNRKRSSKLVEIAKSFDSELEIEYKGQKGNLKSIMEVVLLDLPEVARVTIRAKGHDAWKALGKIEEIIEEEL